MRREPFLLQAACFAKVRNAGWGIDGRRASARVIFFTRMAKALAPGRQLCGFLVSDSLQPAPLFVQSGQARGYVFSIFFNDAEIE